jgi:hypothetical protein
MESTKTEVFFSDQPKTTAKEDEFSRHSFATRLAQAIRLAPNTPGLVVGIEGEWGSGKSTIIEFIKEELTTDKNTIVVSFNPWMISGSESLVEGLLSQLAASIGCDAPEKQAVKGLRAGRSLLGYVGLIRHLKYLKYVPMASWLGNAAEDVGAFADMAADTAGQASKAAGEFADDIEKTLSKLDVSKMKNEVIKALNELDSPIVVVIDDLDRLLPNEIRLVFQAIKAVADFPRVTYLIAYDKNIVTNALGGGAEDRQGKSYLEKIVQVAYPLPSLFPWQIRHFTLMRLDQLLQQLGITLRDYERARWNDAVSHAARLAGHPRNVIRLCNRLLISLPAALGEVNLSDVVVFEAVTQAYSELRNAMLHFPEHFTATGYPSNAAGYEEDWSPYIGKTADERADDWKQHIPQYCIDTATLERACKFIFPMLIDGRVPDDALHHLRIAEGHRLMRVLALSSIDVAYDAVAMHALLVDPPALKDALNAQPVEREILLKWLAAYIPSATAIDELGVCDVLVETANSLLLSNLLSEPTARAISEFAIIILERAQKDKLKVFQSIVSGCPLSIAHDLVLRVAEEQGTWRVSRDGRLPPDKRLISDESKVNEAIDNWLKRVERAVQTQEFLFEPRVRAILFRWAQLGPGLKPIQEEVKRLCNIPGGLSVFVAPYIRNMHPNDLGEFDLIWDADELASLIEHDSTLVGNTTNFCQELRSDQVKKHLSKLNAIETERLKLMERLPA